MLKTKNENLKGKNVVISGSGNVAQYSAEKAIELGAQVLTMSDSSGYIFDPEGIDEKKLNIIKDLKNIKRGRISEYLKKYPKAEFHKGKTPWNTPCHIALPCATQNELTKDDANSLIKNGVLCVCEGANMPSTPEAIEAFHLGGILFSPGKASNAGGVATSGLEMSQNSLRLSWSSREVDEKLQNIMKEVHESCVKYGSQENGSIDYVKGANLAGFVKVADAMIDQGVV
jgi:glutamate dehydrogenase (NADP+)